MHTEDFTPIFVMGSARSGTTMVSHIISSGANYAQYHAETLILNVCKPKYGNIFSSRKKRDLFFADWFRSRQFRESNLTKERFVSIVDNSNCYESLLINFLSAIAKSQNCTQIVDSTPGNAKHLTNIYSTCKASKFICLIRDGRDVAISQTKLGWSNPPPPFKSSNAKLHYAMVQWQETLRIMQKQSKCLDILYVKYEDILSDPQSFKRTIESYLDANGAEFDVSTVNKKGEGNSAFGKLGQADNTSSLERWRSLDPNDLPEITYGIERTLHKFGYSSPEPKFNIRLAIRLRYFRMHVRLKRVMLKIPPISSRLSSTSLEFDN